ncbi:hypothetical protein [Salibacterium halotolerans]|uniref:Uncharacterized protein n=1 Tax=Salibacterium halotolerans TaxID=1884432 RepID=A0A1I5S0Y7_9BACI|nr:hypothetical protein [Salibacterium halotolerans]SFP64403.1 hypothetical protein SAMN05518683_1087 [Salibacterium halotolerans]
MPIITLLAVVYALFFLFVTILIVSSKEEEKRSKRKIISTLAIACVLAIFPTAVLALFLFAMLGSSVFIQHLFSLDVSFQQILTVTVCLFIYWYTVDSIIEKIVQHVMGPAMLHHVVVLLTRIFAFHTIGAITGLNQTSSLLIAAVVSLFLLLIELVFADKEQKLPS